MFGGAKLKKEQKYLLLASCELVGVWTSTRLKIDDESESNRATHQLITN